MKSEGPPESRRALLCATKAVGASRVCSERHKSDEASVFGAQRLRGD